MTRSARFGSRFVTLLVIAAMVLVACGDDDDAAAPGGEREVAIGFVGALTGDSANLGLNIRDGMRVALEEENAKGGPRVIMKEFDTAGEPAQATTIKDRFIGDRQVIGIVGPAFSGESKAVIPDIANAGLLMISPSATNKDLPTIVPNNPTFHRVIGDDALQAFGVGRYLAEAERPRAVSYVHDNSEYGKALTLDTEKEASGRGIRSAGEVLTVDPKSQDFSATVNSVRQQNPSHVFYGGYYTEAGRFKKQLSDAGVNVVFVSGDGALDPGFITAAGPAAEGARIACPCNLALENSSGGLAAFYEAFKQRIGREPGLYSPEAYDAAKILVQGIKAGNRDRPSLVRYVENIGRFDGVSKIIEFESNGNLVRRQFFVFQIQGGKIAPLQTVDVQR